MKGIIWYEQGFKEKAINQLNKIKHNYFNLLAKKEDDNVIIQEKISTNSQMVVFTNNDVWKIVSARTTAKGEACNISYIDRNIPQEMVRTIIQPATKAIPFQAYRYY